MRMIRVWHATNERGKLMTKFYLTISEWSLSSEYYKLAGFSVHLYGHIIFFSSRENQLVFQIEFLFLRRQQSQLKSMLRWETGMSKWPWFHFSFSYLRSAKGSTVDWKLLWSWRFHSCPWTANVQKLWLPALFCNDDGFSISTGSFRPVCPPVASAVGWRPSALRQCSTDYLRNLDLN